MWLVKPLTAPRHCGRQSCGLHSLQESPRRRQQGGGPTLVLSLSDDVTSQGTAGLRSEDEASAVATNA